MIFKVISTLTQQLNDYLKLCFKLQEDIVFISPPKDSDSTSPSNRISLSVINIEKETAGGISFSRGQVSNSHSSKTAPAWQVNIYLLIAAVFIEKQYKDSIQLVSGVLSFIQKNNLFPVDGGASFALEPVNLSMQELSNLWSICGGSYYPSVVCKVRVINIDEQEVIDMSHVVGEQGLASGIKKDKKERI